MPCSSMHACSHQQSLPLLPVHSTIFFCLAWLLYLSSCGTSKVPYIAKIQSASEDLRASRATLATLAFLQFIVFRCLWKGSAQVTEQKRVTEQHGEQSERQKEFAPLQCTGGNNLDLFLSLQIARIRTNGCSTKVRTFSVASL